MTPLLICLVVAGIGLAIWWAIPRAEVSEAGRWLFVLGVAFALWVATR